MASSTPFRVPPQYPCPQGTGSTTFHAPPLDGSLSIPQIFAWHAEHSLEHPMFVFADGDKGLRTIRYPEAWSAMKKASSIVHKHYKRIEDQYIAQRGIRLASQAPTIAVLANADTVSFVTLIVGVMRLGLVVFPISTRNSPAAVAHLLNQTHVLQLMVSPDPSMQRLASEALHLLEKDGIHVETLPMIQFQDVYDLKVDDKEDETLPIPKPELDATAIIFHSSGSTSFPKPIKMNNRTFIQFAIMPYWGEVDLCNLVLGVHPLPAFHGMASCIMTWTISCGIVVACFKPASSPIVPTPENYLEGFLATKSNLLFCPPSFVEAWMQDPANIPALKTLKAIVYAGAPMNREAGDQLVKAGIALHPLYGGTEIGSFSRFISKGVPTVGEWEYFKISPQLDVELLPQEGSDDVFEAAVLESDYFTPNAINATLKGRNMYRTNDLLQRHPTDPTRWKILGRTDDQIMLSTGEKTNPGPLEGILMTDPHIACAIMFGRGKFQNGVIIEPKEEFAFDPRDEGKLAEFRNRIWPSVEKLNEFAPAHSRLFKEVGYSTLYSKNNVTRIPVPYQMILVPSPDKPFEYTAKGSPRKGAIVKAYDAEIEALYAAVEDSSQNDLPPPAEWTHDATLNFVAKAVEKTMRRQLDAGDDFFQQGCDSLQATWIRNTITRALRQANKHQGLPNNIVYAHPTITSLTAYVLSLFSTSAGQSDAEIVAEKTQNMQAILDKYVKDLPTHKPAQNGLGSSEDEVILVTGTTGRLGSHLLKQLLDRPSVTKVYALNRASTFQADLKERHKKNFTEWGLDEQLLDSNRVEFLTADLAKPKFGLEPEVYGKIQKSVTGIIHNAWLLNFNVSLSTFEPLIAGVRNLVDLALSSPHTSPPSILFTSSISVVINAGISPVPETPVPAKAAVGAGYYESKWVAEQILLQTSKASSLRVTVVRVGQMSGDRAVGGWNAKEWFPALVRGSQLLQCFPQRNEAVSWIPVDVAASTLLDMLGSSEPVLHLVHPNPTTWFDIAVHTSTALRLPLAPYDEWLARLRAQAVGGDTTNPAVQLLEFFNGLAEGGEPALSTDRAVQVSDSLRGAAQVGEADIKRWVGYWRGIGFLAPTA
ncbi:hypothetical protein EWM64_g1812 [Hericium alpestre]|uniref:Polyketide synthase-like phosphopantetheine-binding domain-containing protein n=1 Tax=Hericium alpestre TaxID=135208 RepID=A0A4Z0A9F4_9AGAM|nr:hypothetical protein EWM64_g1812 [Hericium alpestre]